MTLLKIFLALAAGACTAIAFAAVAFMLAFGSGDAWPVAFFAGVALIGVAGIFGLFVRGPWGPALIVAQALGLVLYWLIPAERSLASWFMPLVPIVTALLGIVAMGRSRREGGGGR